MSPHHHMAVEHMRLREALSRLCLVVGPVNCPPAGHIYLGMLESLAQYFANDLSTHAAHEEAYQYPALASRMRPGELEQLLADHRVLLVLAEAFTETATTSLVAPGEVAWAALREHATALATLLADHLTREEAIADRVPVA